MQCTIEKYAKQILDACERASEEVINASYLLFFSIIVIIYVEVFTMGNTFTKHRYRSVIYEFRGNHSTDSSLSHSKRDKRKRLGIP